MARCGWCGGPERQIGGVPFCVRRCFSGPRLMAIGRVFESPAIEQWSPLAPHSPDPGVCRWCGGPCRPILEGDAPICVAGCAHAQMAPYLLTCADCGRFFHTGYQRAAVCWTCAQADHLRYPDDWDRLPVTGRVS